MAEKLIGLGAGISSGKMNNMLNKTASCIGEVATKVQRVSRGNLAGHQGMRW